MANGDRSLLAQVLVNLISNAMKFSAKKDRPVIEVSAISDAVEHTYFVRDNGAGFDPRFGAKLFGVFQRLHDPAEFPGTGVGLALVQRIITRHGGRVWAEGEPGRRRDVLFHLPRSATMDQFEQIEILLVEDNPLDAELTMSALKGGKVANHITWVKDGQEALDYLFRAGRVRRPRGRARRGSCCSTSRCRRSMASKC